VYFFRRRVGRRRGHGRVDVRCGKCRMHIRYITSLFLSVCSLAPLSLSLSLSLPSSLPLPPSLSLSLSLSFFRARSRGFVYVKYAPLHCAGLASQKPDLSIEHGGDSPCCCFSFKEEKKKKKEKRKKKKKRKVSLGCSNLIRN